MYRPEKRWDYAHFVLMQELLDEVTAGLSDRIVFSVAIRHGKTEHNTIGYIAYRLWLDPTCRIILAMYAADKARDVSRSIRRLCRDVGVELSRERNAASEWETTSGGGLIALGRASVASMNADLIVVDDAVGSRAEAESPAMRDSTWDWFSNDLMSRIEPHTAVLVTGSRWHTDDMLGRIEDRYGERWEWLTLRGEASYGPKEEYLDALNREEGDLLWPELRPRAWMEDQKLSLGSYGFESQMQLRPNPREGGMFKWDWWKLLADVPMQGPMIRYWDLAGTEATGGNDPDYSAGALLCRMTDGRTAIIDMERFRYSVARRDARMREIAVEDLAAYHGRVVWWIEHETGIAGKERTAALVLSLQNLGLAVYTEYASGSKRSRAEPLAAKAEAGNVGLCPGAWRDSFRLEASSFVGTGGGHDDQIDAAAGAENKLIQERGTVSFTSLVP